MELKRSPLLSSLPPQAETTSARARASRLSAADSRFGIYFLLFPIIDAGAYRCPPRRVVGVGMGLPSAQAGVAELADARDSKSRVLRDVWVRPPPPACGRQWSVAGTECVSEDVRVRRITCQRSYRDEM